MKYYILYNDENHGPHTIEELEQYDLNSSSRVWAPGWPSWKDASEVEEIAAYFAEKEAKAAIAAESARIREQERIAARQREQQQQMNRQFGRQTGGNEAPAYGTGGNDIHAASGNTTTTHDNEIPPVPGSVPEPPITKEREWFLGINNRELGPYPESQLLQNGLTPETLVWCENMPDWMTASNIPELAYLLPARATTPEPPVNVVEEEPLNVEYEMANPYLTGFIGIGLWVLDIILALALISKSEYFLSAAITAIVAPVLWLLCCFISGGRVNSAKNEGKFILAGRRCGAARAWGWVSILTGTYTVITLLVALQ